MLAYELNVLLLTYHWFVGVFVTITGQGVGHSTEEIGAPSKFGVLKQIDEYFRARGTIHVLNLSSYPLIYLLTYLRACL